MTMDLDLLDDSLRTRFATVDVDGTYTGLVENMDKAGEDAVREALAEDFFGEPTEPAVQDGTLPYRPAVLLREATRDSIVPKAIEAGLLMMNGALFGQITILRAWPQTAETLDVYVDGRLEAELPVPLPDPAFGPDGRTLFLSVRLRRPEASFCHVEFCARNRVVGHQKVAPYTDAHIPDFNGGFFGVQGNMLVGWIVDRNDRQRNLPVILESAGVTHTLVAGTKAPFSSQPVRKFSLPLASLGEAQQHAVSMRNGITGTVLHRGEFQLIVSQGVKVVWYPGRTEAGDLFATVVAFPQSKQKATVTLMDDGAELEPHQASMPDPPNLAYTDQHNSVRFPAAAMAGLDSTRLRLRIAGLGTTVETQPFDLAGLPQITPPEPVQAPAEPAADADDQQPAEAGGEAPGAD